MSMEEIFLHAVSKAQRKDFCHKKQMKLVENAFVNSKLDELLEAFVKALYRCYPNDCANKNPFISRALEFLAKVAMMITLKCVHPIEITDANGTGSQVYDISLDPFFINVLKHSLKFANVEKTEVRFNTCYFIMTLLQNIGNNVEMDYSICNIITSSLVKLLYDPKAIVRIQAIKALVRLQEPSSPDCIILRSFCSLFTDPNNEVRKAVISNIAPHPQSFSKIKMRLTDTDIGVRQAAYLKFADVNPKLYLKIIDRNTVLTCGLADTNKKINHIMTEKLLPKWLNHFEGNYLLFFRSLRLDADENDINNFEKLCTELLNIFLRHNSLTDIVKYLPVNGEDKLIPIQQIRLESVFYWSGVISYLRGVENGVEHLENILPELTSFSNYIEKVVKEKFNVSLDEWENLEFQTVIYQLFEISSGFDMSDEVGRKTLYSLVLQILTTNKFQPKVIEKMIKVALQLSRDIDSLSIDLCQVISEIREPLIDELPSEDKLRKQNFEITQMKVKMHQLEIDEEEALKKKDFQHAHIVQNEIKECQRQLDTLKNMYCVSEKVRVAKDDPETLCRCLDILIGLLKITNVISPALQTCRDEFLMQLLNNNTSEVHWRFILCLGLFSLLDKDLAFKHANFLCLPIATYRAIQNYDKIALKTSVACVTDLIRIYGVKVIGVEENAQSETNQDCNPTASRRKLYTEDFNEPEISQKDITIEFIIDIILDMLDDEDEGVRQTASTSICRLIVNNFPVSPELFCRLILKWYSPQTEKQDTKLRQQLGSIIQCFASNTKGAKKVVQRSVVSIISSIVNASGSSPLLEIDIENVLRFLVALTNTINDNDTENIHYDIAVDLIERMLNKPNDACTPYLVKLLSYLEIKIEDEEKCKNLLNSTESLVSDLADKIPRKNLLKFRDKLMTSMQAFKEVENSECEPKNGTTRHESIDTPEQQNIDDEVVQKISSKDSDDCSDEECENALLDKIEENTSTKEVENLECDAKDGTTIHKSLDIPERESRNGQVEENNKDSIDCSDEEFPVTGSENASIDDKEENTVGGEKSGTNRKAKVLKNGNKLETILEDERGVKRKWNNKSAEESDESSDGESPESHQKKEMNTSEIRRSSRNVSKNKNDKSSETKENTREKKGAKPKLHNSPQLKRTVGTTNSGRSVKKLGSSPGKPKENGNEKPQEKIISSKNSKLNSTQNEELQNLNHSNNATNKTRVSVISSNRSSTRVQLNKEIRIHSQQIIKNSSPLTRSQMSSQLTKQHSVNKQVLQSGSSKDCDNSSDEESSVSKSEFALLDKRKEKRVKGEEKKIKSKLKVTRSDDELKEKVKKGAKRKLNNECAEVSNEPSDEGASEPQKRKNSIGKQKRPNEILEIRKSLRSSIRNKNKNRRETKENTDEKKGAEPKLNNAPQKKRTEGTTKPERSVKKFENISNQKDEDDEKLKDKTKACTNSKLNSMQKGTNRVLRNSNHLINDINKTPLMNNKSPKVSIIPLNRNSTKVQLNKNINKSHLQQVIKISSPLTRSRMKSQLNESNTSSSSQLNSSSFSDETILKTILHDDEEVMGNLSIESTSSSLINTSRESKKENLSINMSSSSSSLRRSIRRKRSRKEYSPESLPRKKIMRTK